MDCHCLKCCCCAVLRLAVLPPCTAPDPLLLLLLRLLFRLLLWPACHENRPLVSFADAQVLIKVQRVYVARGTEGLDREGYAAADESAGRQGRLQCEIASSRVDILFNMLMRIECSIAESAGSYVSSTLYLRQQYTDHQAPAISPLSTKPSRLV